MTAKESRIRTVGVLGAGTMGHGIAQVIASAGYNVVMMDVSEEILLKALEAIKWSLGKLVEKKRISEETSAAISRRIRVTTRMEELAPKCELVVEAVPEDLELKCRVLREADAIAHHETLFASNTSTLPITDLAECTMRGDRLIGTHFFHPPQLMPLVEIVRGKKTSEETRKVIMEFVKTLGKEIVVCKKDVPGFIANRILGPLLQEAGWTVYRGEASIVEVDSTSKYTLGLPMGLFELADYSGIDVMYRVSEEVRRRDPRNTNPCPIFRDYFEKGWYGQKKGRGFYEYNRGTYGRASIPMDAAGKVDPVKLFAPAINAAAWVVREEVASVEDVERAVRLGLGFPEGLLHMADKWGLDSVVEALREKQGRYGDYYTPDTLLVEMVSQRRLGVRVGKGFFEYQTSEKIYEEIMLRKEPPLAWITINRPQRLNALTLKTVEELEIALDTIRDDGSVRVVIIKGAGEKAFSSGADVTAFGALTPDKALETSRKFQEGFSKLENFPKPTIAAIDGYALGGGCELALACDFRFASDRSQIGQTEIRLGLIPGAGGTQRLARVVGEAKAKELILLGERISAQDAERIGLVNKVVPYQRLDEEARSSAMNLAEGPPIAMKLAKLAIQSSRQGTEDGFKVEAQAFAALFSTKDLAEGVSAFLSKRKPEFKGE